jgi:hypothetical protein
MQKSNKKMLGGSVSEGSEVLTQIWFEPELWPPIVAIKRYSNNSDVIHDLRTTFRKPSIPSLCMKLARSNLWDLCLQIRDF